MQEINVFIREKEIKVPEEIIAMRSGDPVVWCIHNCATSNVKWVDIEFAKNSPPFFSGRRENGTKGPQKPLTMRGTEVESGHGYILGIAPSPGKGQHPFKYTVHARVSDGGSDILEPLDPEIVVEDP